MCVTSSWGIEFRETLRTKQMHASHQPWALTRTMTLKGGGLGLTTTLYILVLMKSLVLKS